MFNRVGNAPRVLRDASKKDLRLERSLTALKGTKIKLSVHLRSQQLARSKMMTRRLYAHVILLFLSCNFLGRPVHGDELDLRAIRKTLSKLAERELKKGVASISIALVKDGKVVLKAAWGHANVWSKSPATPDSIYCTGSTFKAVTATALLQLAEQGKLSLDDPANKHLGKHRLVADKDNKVTVRQLLDHTSGLTPGAATKDIWSRKLPTQLKEIPAKLKLVAKPGAKWAYNNHAYAVAGLLIEQVSGQSFEDYVLENVLRPLGVKTKGPVHPTPAMVERMALPYVPGPNRKPQAVPFLHYDVYPAGDIYLTAEDMARFLAAHLNDGKFNGRRILSSKSVKESHVPNKRNYALGWSVTRKAGQTTISHDGGVPGYRTAMVGNVDAKVGAYVMSNAGTMSSLANAAVTLLSGKKLVAPKDRKSVKLPRKILKAYVGRYQLGPKILSIRLKDGQLSAQLTGQRSLAVYAEAKDRLFAKVVDAQFTIKRNKDGKVTSLVLHQNGRDMAAKKVK